jgi:peptide/nickel transport system substrate-binding protein
MTMAQDKIGAVNSAGLSRRQFLVVSTAAGLGLSGLLASCAKGPGATSSSPTGSVGKPRRGGTLRFGCTGGGSTDTLDAHLPVTNPDNARMAMLYDQLTRLDNSGKPEMVLAESITPNADATEWTIKIHPGVVTHQGKKFTANDVLFSVKRMFQVKGAGASAIGNVDLAGSRVQDDTTLILKYKTPYSQLVEGLTNYACNMVPEGYDPKNPDGTGPFKYQSFTPGVSSKFVRNDNYWVEGLPYLDAIVTTDISDETAQISGLQSGQLDVINFLSATSISVLKSGSFKTIISKTGSFGPFTLRVDKAPFSDVRVRQALRMVVDRPQMLNQVFGGYGSLGNDVFGITDPMFPTDLPQRHQDIDQAKSLLRQAGHSDLSLQLITTDNAPGQVNAAAVFASQAKKAGVSVKIVKQTPTDYFASSYLKVPFSQDYDPTNPYLIGVSQWTAGVSAPYNPSFFNDPTYLALYQQAVATPDTAKQKSLIHDMAHIDYTSGGNIIPYFFPTIDGCSPRLQGVEESATGLSPGGFYFKKFWFSS